MTTTRSDRLPAGDRPRSRSALYAADSVLIVVQPRDLHRIGTGRHRLGAGRDRRVLGHRSIPVAGILINQRDWRRNDHDELIAKLRAFGAESGIQVLGEPVPLKADVSRLANLEMGADEHPKRPVWARVLRDKYGTILEGLAK